MVVWDLSSGDLKRRHGLGTLNGGGVTSVGGIVGSAGLKIELRRADTVDTFRSFGQHAAQLEFAPDGKTFAAATPAQYSIFELEPMRCLQRFPPRSTHPTSRGSPPISIKTV